MEQTFDLTSITLLTTIALLCGLGLQSFRVPASVGFILAGIVLGPGGFALVSNSESIGLFAELGVLVLLFLIGMEVSLRAFKTVLGTVLLCALLQAAVAVGLTFGIGYLLNWPFQQAVVLGFVLALSSTAIGIKILEDIGELRTEVGRITIGVLIAQDLLLVPMLIIAGSLGSENPLTLMLFLKVGVGVALLAGLVWYLSRNEKFVLPFRDRIRVDHDIGPLAMLVFCFILATIAGLVGLSASYGAFIAGLIVGSSTDRKAAISTLQPIQSILLMVFFLSIGLLVDVRFILANLATVLSLVFFVTIAKTLANILILNALGQPWERSFLAGVVMAQIGEFSFVIAAAGLHGGAISGEGYQIALSVIALSLMISPFWLLTAQRLEAFGQVGARGVRSTFATLYETELVTSKNWSKLVFGYVVRVIRALVNASRKKPQSATPAPTRQSPNLEVIEAEVVEKDAPEAEEDGEVQRRA